MDNIENNYPLSNEKVLTNKPSYFKKIITYLFFFVCILIASLFFFLSPPANFPEGGIYNIEEGSSLRKVSLTLQEGKFIRSRVMFESFVIMYGGEKHIIPGDYLFDRKSSVFEVARRISLGKKNLSSLKVTIPEGFSNSEIKDTFSSKLSKFNPLLFTEKARDKEGYLFPDTYFFLTTDTEDEVIKVMNNNFNKKIEKLSSKIDSSGKSKEDIITMASIVEKEAKGDSDREYIAGILWKRLSINMPLQVDAAPITYKERGLPESPIANPGLEAIIATLNPKSSPYLYYLHDADGNIHYAKNFEEHKSNKSKYLK